MANSSAELHEDSLSPGTVNHHRAIVSLMEELEAVDWYNQRVEATDDDSLAAVLAHNRDEEKEHAAMTLEWLRRHDPALDGHLRTYLFTEPPVTEVEEASTGGPGGPGSAGRPGGQLAAAEGSLGIGTLKGIPGR
jgi:ferritin-like protein